ncbi:MAG: hypothetical protein RR415_13880 [Ruthenibacterium sp.]
MDDIINISDFRNNAPTIELHVANVSCNVKVFFNMNCCQTLIESHESGDDYRISFIKTVFEMWKDTEPAQPSELTESDFVEISDCELLLVLNAILDNDPTLNTNYQQAEGIDQYERFYHANESVISASTKGISKSLEVIKTALDGLNRPLLASLQSAASQLIIPASGLTKIQSAFASIQSVPRFEIPPALFEVPKYDFTGLQSALTAATQFDYPGLTAVLKSIPQPSFDIQHIITPLSDMAQSIAAISKGISQSLQSSLTEMAKATSSLLSSVDFSLLLYRKEWNKQREMFLSYGWFYIEELPEGLVNDVYERKEKLSQADVDEMITLYFRRNRCDALKQMTKRWDKLPYFSCRKSVFHEALVNHSRRYYNSSTMMMTLQTEGVITDFVRLKLETPRFKVKKALLDIKSKLEDSNDVSIYEFEVFSDIIERIEAAFSEEFDCANPDSTSNQSRDKIAHGHAYEPENEANSLKQFLYLNEVYHLLLLLSQEEQ